MENGPRPEMAENGRQNGKMAHFGGHFFHFSGHFLGHFSRGPFSIFFPIFPGFLRLAGLPFHCSRKIEWRFSSLDLPSSEWRLSRTKVPEKILHAKLECRTWGLKRRGFKQMRGCLPGLFLSCFRIPQMLFGPSRKRRERPGGQTHLKPPFVTRPVLAAQPKRKVWRMVGRDFHETTRPRNM